MRGHRRPRRPRRRRRRRRRRRHALPLSLVAACRTLNLGPREIAAR